MARYVNIETARLARKAYLRNYRLGVRVRRCGECDGYHTSATASQLRLPKKMLAVLREIALGYTTLEIAEHVGLSPESVNTYAYTLRTTFDALNSAHLVAIAISLGLVSPNEFVPPLTERCISDQHNRSQAHG
jgi:DNA-binding CsgD family transcriptional regulator